MIAAKIKIMPVIQKNWVFKVDTVASSGSRGVFRNSRYWFPASSVSSKM